MKKLIVLAVSISLSIASTAAVFMVSSQSEFNNAQSMSSSGDQIVWNTGIYSDIYMNLTQDGLTISAEVSGGVTFSGNSRVQMSSDNTIFEGFQFVGGDINDEDVINITGSNNLITQINIQDYTSYKYLRIRESSQYCDVTYCNFENRINLDDQNILSILVDENQPGYHKVQHCSFKNFDGTGNDMGIEPIRIGLSTQADRISRSVVEYCYFTQCNGDGELISSKATENVYRYNTFEDNPLAELVLRHGSYGIVYGNFFINGKGGVRVREGQNHFIYNNYFTDLDDRPIYLQNEPSDPISDIHIAFNTITNCAELRLGGDNNGVNEPENVNFTNNIFANPLDELFQNPTGTETWIGNISFGDLGMSSISGITSANPQFVQNASGYSELTVNSPARNAAQTGYLELPQFQGIANIDESVLFDLMQENRPGLIDYKDIGCLEFPHISEVKPIATESNTGPCYLNPEACEVQDDSDCKADFNEDGEVTASDLTQFLAVFGLPCSD